MGRLVTFYRDCYPMALKREMDINEFYSEQLTIGCWSPPSFVVNKDKVNKIAVRHINDLVLYELIHKFTFVFGNSSSPDNFIGSSDKDYFIVYTKLGAEEGAEFIMEGSLLATLVEDSSYIINGRDATGGIIPLKEVTDKVASNPIPEVSTKKEVSGEEVSNSDTFVLTEEERKFIETLRFLEIPIAKFKAEIRKGFI